MRTRVVITLYSQKFDRLVFQRIETLCVTGEDLNRRDQGLPSTSPWRTSCARDVQERSFSRCQAATPPTVSAVVRYAAMTV